MNNLELWELVKHVDEKANNLPVSLSEVNVYNTKGDS